jgi:PD-(D/E)XK endonuclease
VLTTDQKGAIAELAIAGAALKLGSGVYRPVAGGGRYDLIFEFGDRLLRIQCKTGVLRGDVLAIPCYSCRRTRHGFVKRPYTSDEIDAIAAYAAELERCFLLPISEFGTRTYVQLRLAPCANGQRLRINWADDFEFAATLGRLGAIAQLGERLHGMQEVAGSSPAGSIDQYALPS